MPVRLPPHAPQTFRRPGEPLDIQPSAKNDIYRSRTPQRHTEMLYAKTAQCIEVQRSHVDPVHAV